MSDRTMVDSFTGFVKETEPRLKQALCASLGRDVGLERGAGLPITHDSGGSHGRRVLSCHRMELPSRWRDTGPVTNRNVLGGTLEPCGADPLTGFYRDGSCETGPEDRGSHTICAVVTEEFLDHQRRIGNDLSTPMPQYRFPGLRPGDRWCVTATNWLRAHHDGVAAPVVLAATHEGALDIVSLEALQEHAVDVPRDPGSLEV